MHLYSAGAHASHLSRPPLASAITFPVMDGEADQAPQDGATPEFEVGNAVKHKRQCWLGKVVEIGVPKDGVQHVFVEWEKSGTNTDSGARRKRSIAASSLVLVKDERSAPKKWSKCELDAEQTQALAAADLSVEKWEPQDAEKATAGLAELGIDLDGASGKWRINNHSWWTLEGYVRTICTATGASFFRIFFFPLAPGIVDPLFTASI